ncbi:MAG: thiamine biosynthesis protein ThiS [Chlorobi bacterium]|nr:thiamine biosynthesis protein ThiS [Chlorobiota bacterium]
MQLQLNGSPVESVAGTLNDLLLDRGVDPGQPGIAVAVNGELIPRSEWKGHRLNERDDIELITAMQGG